MSFDDGRPRLPGAGPAGPGLIGRVFGALFGIAALILALTVSVFVFAFVLVIGVLVVGYFWWKTRAVRRQLRAMQEQFAARGMDGFGGAGPHSARGEAAPPPGGRVIDGEAVREHAPESDDRR